MRLAGRVAPTPSTSASTATAHTEASSAQPSTTRARPSTTWRRPSRTRSRTRRRSSPRRRRRPAIGSIASATWPGKASTACVAASALRVNVSAKQEKRGQGVDRLCGGYDYLVNEQPLVLGSIGLALGAVSGRRGAQHAPGRSALGTKPATTSRSKGKKPDASSSRRRSRLQPWPGRAVAVAVAVAEGVVRDRLGDDALSADGKKHADDTSVGLRSTTASATYPPPTR